MWSPTQQQGDLCRNLEAGRAWFYDPLRWDGVLNLAVGGMHMGGVLFTKKRMVNVRCAPPTARGSLVVDLVVGKCDFAGAASAAADQPGPHGCPQAVRRRRLARPASIGAADATSESSVRGADGDMVGILQPRLGAATASSRRHARTCAARR